MLDIKGVKKSYGEFQLDCSLNVEKEESPVWLERTEPVRVPCLKPYLDSFLMMAAR